MKKEINNKAPVEKKKSQCDSCYHKNTDCEKEQICKGFMPEAE